MRLESAAKACDDSATRKPSASSIKERFGFDRCDRSKAGIDRSGISARNDATNRSASDITCGKRAGKFTIQRPSEGRCGRDISFPPTRARPVGVISLAAGVGELHPHRCKVDCTGTIQPVKAICLEMAIRSPRFVHDAVEPRETRIFVLDLSFPLCRASKSPLSGSENTYLMREHDRRSFGAGRERAKATAAARRREHARATKQHGELGGYPS